MPVFRRAGLIGRDRPAPPPPPEPRPPPGRLRRRLGLWLRRLLLLLVLGPPLVLLAYRFVPVPLTPLMVIRLIEGEGWQRDWVPLAEIAPGLQRAVIAAEDARFCSHNGFDWKEIAVALDDYQAGEKLRGASTISQQTARNLVLWPGGGVARKAVEAYLTTLLELMWPKRRILEVYLNIIEWGPGIYGAEAAAAAHFHRTAAAVNAQEAAQLAAVLPNPRRFSAGRPSEYVLRRSATIRSRMPAVPLECLRLAADRL